MPIILEMYNKEADLLLQSFFIQETIQEREEITKTNLLTSEMHFLFLVTASTSQHKKSDTFSFALQHLNQGLGAAPHFLIVILQ